MKFRLYILLFCVAIFSLTAIGLVIVYMATPFGRLLLLAPYTGAWALVWALAVDFLIGDGKLNRKKVLLLAFGVMVISATVTHSVKTVVTPNWSFSVSTNKSTYILGEDVKITVSLENLGFITHSFKSAFSDPVQILIMCTHRNVWYSPYHDKITEFTVPPHQSLEWTFIWNQTNKNYPEQEIEPGTYSIRAIIGSVTSDRPFFNPIFSDWTSINITSI